MIYETLLLHVMSRRVRESTKVDLFATPTSEEREDVVDGIPKDVSATKIYYDGNGNALFSGYNIQETREDMK